MRQLAGVACAALVLPSRLVAAAELPVTEIRLPALRINGQPARAHTQGLEIQSGQYYVTARREDVRPKQALLLRTTASRTDWDVWDLTPLDADGHRSSLDHPGGLQSDGKRLWIPLAESRRHGNSVIRAFSLAGMVPGRPLKAEFEFPVEDHIGAVAVSRERRLLFGANWDTETVYVWDFEGRRQRTLNGVEMKRRKLGVVRGARARGGLAVQDWKGVDGRLFASGLFRGPGVTPESPRSRLFVFTRFAEAGFRRRAISLPRVNGVELAREAMAIADGTAHFLPEDLGASNRVFRVRLADFVEPRVSPDSLSSQGGNERTDW